TTAVNRTKAIFAGLLAGLLAGVVMTAAMLLLAVLGVATPLVIIGDRLSVFIPPGPFLSIMGKVGGYNHLKQLGVGSTIAGQFIVPRPLVTTERSTKAALSSLLRLTNCFIS